MSISAVGNTGAVTAGTALENTNKSLLVSDEFLKLLTVQLSSQDPFNPMDDKEFISQMANFSSLEQMSTLSKNFSSFSARQEQLSSQTFLGKQVSIQQGSAAAVTGTVSSVGIDSEGAIYVTVNGTQYSVGDVKTVSLPSGLTE